MLGLAQLVKSSDASLGLGAKETQYANWLKQWRITPEQHKHYDFRSAFEAGATPGVDPHEAEIDPVTGQPYLHWDSQFKKDTHPHRFIPSELGVFDSKYGFIAPMQIFRQVATPEQLKNYKDSSYILPKDEVESFLGSEPKRIPPYMERK